MLKDKLLELNTLRDDFVHRIDSTVHKRPQKQNSKKNGGNRDATNRSRVYIVYDTG